MSERIIPITMKEEPEDNSDGDEEQKIFEPPSANFLEQQSIKSEKVSIRIKAESEKKPDSHDYLKEFDLFEGRTKCSLLPNVNVPEKIILVIDRAQEEEEENLTPFKVNNSTLSPLDMLKRALHVFLNLKHFINKHHEFAIMTLNENSADWLTNFTSDIKKLNNVIDNIEECAVEDTFNLSSLLELMQKHTSISKPDKPEQPPDYIVRMIILWGRSYTLPYIEKTLSMSTLLEDPYFVCDILVTHEPMDSANNSHKIIKLLQSICQKSVSYLLPVGRDSVRLHQAMAKLLGHPLQRPLQVLQKV